MQPARTILSMKRFLFVVLCSTLLLSACGSSKTKAACEGQQYWNGTIGLCLPAGWSVIEREGLTERGIAEDVIVAFKRDEAVAGQFPTVLVTQEALKQQVDPAAYSEANVRSVSILPGYKDIDTKNMTLDSVKVSLHIFTAQPQEGEAERRFYQVSTATKNFGYSVTGLAPLSPPKDVESEIETMLSSVTFVEPAGAGK